MTAAHQALYADHVARLRTQWDAALAVAGQEAVLVHSGSPRVSFLDDYQYAFRPNPHFLHWLPLTHHPDCALLILPGERARLYYFQPDDYWHLPPADPDPWWAGQFDLDVVRDAEAWQRGVGSAIADSGLAWKDLAAIGDSPSLQAVFEDRQSPPSATRRPCRPCSRTGRSIRLRWWKTCTWSVPARQPTNWHASAKPRNWRPGRMSRPSAVRWVRLRSRRNKSPPSSSSSFRIARDSDGWATLKFSAARV